MFEASPYAMYRATCQMILRGRRPPPIRFDPVSGRNPTEGSGDAPTVRPPEELSGTVPLLLIPTLNEEHGLEQTLRELQEVRHFPHGRRPRVLVVDGNSSDRTEQVARSHGTEFFVQHGRGKGAAIRDGLAWAAAQGYDRVGVIDADATYPCDRLPAMFGLLDDGTDVVIGVRQPDRPPHVSARDFVHRVGNGILNLCAAQFSRGPVLDVCSGFWGVRTAAVSKLGLLSDGFEVESELFVKSFRHGLRVVQIPVEYRERVGTAKLHAVRDGIRILLSIIRHSVPSAPADGVSRRAVRPAVRVVPPSRDLNALLLALQPAAVLVVCVPSRHSEATAIEQSLAAFPTNVQVLATATPWISQSFAEDGPNPSGGSVRFGGPEPIVVTLPDDGWGIGSRSSILVDVPRSGRIVSLGPGGSSSAAPAGVSGVVERYRRTRRAERAPGTFSILGATLDPSGVRKELALLTANVAESALEIFRPRRRVGPRGLRSMARREFVMDRSLRSPLRG